MSRTSTRRTLTAVSLGLCAGLLWLGARRKTPTPDTARNVERGIERRLPLRKPEKTLVAEGPEPGVPVLRHSGETNGESVDPELVGLAETNPERAAELAAALPKSPARHVALAEIMAVWADTSPVAALAWLMARGELKDDLFGELLGAVFGVWAWKEPATAAAWLSENTSAPLREPTRALIGAWSELDHETAAQWAAADLTVDWRGRLLSELFSVFPEAGLRGQLAAGIDQDVIDTALAHAVTALRLEDQGEIAGMVRQIADPVLRALVAEAAVRKAMNAHQTDFDKAKAILGLENADFPPTRTEDAATSARSAGSPEVEEFEAAPEPPSP